MLVVAVPHGWLAASLILELYCDVAAHPVVAVTVKTNTVQLDICVNQYISISADECVTALLVSLQKNNNRIW